eukprot:3786417-Pyramimonas_sp.AAC.1
MDEHRKHTLPQYLHSKAITDKRAAKRPDIVIIYGVRGNKKLPAEFVPPRQREDRRLILLRIRGELHCVGGYGCKRNGQNQEISRQATGLEARRLGAGVAHPCVDADWVARRDFDESEEAQAA